MYSLSDFDYLLPEALIAQYPAPRGSSRLLHLTPPDTLHDMQVADIATLINPGDLIVVNNTRVMHARLEFQRLTGGRGEILIERVTDTHIAYGQFKISRRPQFGEHLCIPGSSYTVEIIDIKDRWITIKSHDLPFFTLLERHGKIPLPPYIKRDSNLQDETCYQTIFASTPGAVAAPTAGLHFTPSILQSLVEKGVRQASVTLHVGAGTFLPVKHENLDQHIMHEEWFHIPEDTVEAIHTTRKAGNQVIAIGTTTLRALESAAQSGVLNAGAAETRLFIRPGYHFRIVDRLFTNFHLPCSTLLMLISAFGGMKAIQHAYQHAISNEYRFFSYGDAMLIERNREQF